MCGGLGVCGELGGIFSGLRESEVDQDGKCMMHVDALKAFMEVRSLLIRLD